MVIILLALQGLILAEAAVIFNQRLVLINEKTPRYFFSLDGRYSVRLTHRPLLLLWGDIQNIYFEDKFLGKVTNFTSFSAKFTKSDKLFEVLLRHREQYLSIWRPPAARNFLKEIFKVAS